MRTSLPIKTKAIFKPQDFQKNGITLDQVLELKEAFDLFDIEGQGLIDAKELKASMTSLGFQAKNQTLFNAVNELASAGSGNIDFPKFFDLMTARLSNKQSRDNLRKVFILFDDEKSGFLSIKNLRRVVKEVGENIDEAELQQMIERADVDNDGLISEEEFYAIMTKKSLRK